MLDERNAATEVENRTPSFFLSSREKKHTIILLEGKMYFARSSQLSNEAPRKGT
jgi:hypothetical protein